MQAATVVWRVALMVCALVLGAGLAAAQTTSTEIKAFEVVSVDGNQVVLNGADGAREITVPEDFRFTVGGKQISVHELQPGMKGSATITTRTTVKPVYVTEVKQAEVVQVSGSSIIVRGAKGFQSFVEGDVDKRGIKIYKDGKPVSFAGLSKGDRLTATIVTEGTPRIITERDVQARLAEAPPAPIATPSAAPLPSTSTSSSAGAPTSSPSAGQFRADGSCAGGDFVSRDIGGDHISRGAGGDHTSRGDGGIVRQPDALGHRGGDCAGGSRHLGSEAATGCLGSDLCWRAWSRRFQARSAYARPVGRNARRRVRPNAFAVSTA